MRVLMRSSGWVHIVVMIPAEIPANNCWNAAHFLSFLGFVFTLLSAAAITQVLELRDANSTWIRPSSLRVIDHRERSGEIFVHANSRDISIKPVIIPIAPDISNCCENFVTTTSKVQRLQPKDGTTFRRNKGIRRYSSPFYTRC